jgi:hypothetical protein
MMILRKEDSFPANNFIPDKYRDNKNLFDGVKIMANKQWDEFDEQAELEAKAISQFGHGKNAMGVKKENIRFTKRVPQCMAYNESNCNKFLR